MSCLPMQGLVTVSSMTQRFVPLCLANTCNEILDLFFSALAIYSWEWKIEVCSRLIRRCWAWDLVAVAVDLVAVLALSPHLIIRRLHPLLPSVPFHLIWPFCTPMVARCLLSPWRSESNLSFFFFWSRGFTTFIRYPFNCFYFYAFEIFVY